MDSLFYKVQYALVSSKEQVNRLIKFYGDWSENRIALVCGPAEVKMLFSRTGSYTERTQGHGYFADLLCSVYESWEELLNREARLCITVNETNELTRLKEQHPLIN
ncbi:MAG: hypothetical protein V4543_00855 [Bacteroidota bacterium]